MVLNYLQKQSLNLLNKKLKPSAIDFVEGLNYICQLCLVLKMALIWPNILLPFGKPALCAKLFCLSLISKMPIFYFNYTIYFGLLIFCCQIVAIYSLYQSPKIKQLFFVRKSKRQTEIYLITL